MSGADAASRSTRATTAGDGSGSWRLLAFRRLVCTTRRTAATILAALGVDPTAVQALLGHSSMLVTQGYQHLTAEMLAPAMDALHAAFEANA